MLAIAYKKGGKMNSIYPNLVKMMSDTGMSIEDLSEELKIGEYLILAKLSGLTDWSLEEVFCVCKSLNCEDIRFLFTQEK